MSSPSRLRLRPVLVLVPVLAATPATSRGAALQAGDEPPLPPFVEVGARVLAGVSTRCGSAEKDYIVEVNGGGLALGDFDGDGDHDLALVDGSTLERVTAGESGFPPRLFLNDGRAGFAPAGEAWAMAGGRWGTGVAAGDLEGDGDLDLLVTEWGPDRLFRNDAHGGFEEAKDAGLVGERWGTSAAFFDADRDGSLDLVVVNYLAFDPAAIPSRTDGACRWKGHAVMCGPEGLTPVHDQLYRNRGDGRFEDVSQASGFRPRDAGFGLGVMTLDVDVDGDTDLYVTNDSTPNHLWENDGAGQFREIGLRLGVALDAAGKEQAGMGIATGDLNGDGRPDLFATNFSGEANALYLSAGKRFRERAAPLGIGGPSQRMLGWGTGMADFDLDGREDLFVLNGHVYPQADEPGTDSSYAQADVFHRARPDGRFTVEPLSDGPPSVTRAGAPADLDGDGDLDLVALDLDGAVRVLIDTARQPAFVDAEAARGGPHWLAVRLRGETRNRQGLGARVTLWLDDETALWREVRTAGGFQAAVPAEASFGLGARAAVARLVVDWPSGRRTELLAPEVDRVLTIEEPGEAPGEEAHR